MSNAAKYFWYIIVCAGTISIWLPALISHCTESFKLSDLHLNLTTFFLILLISASADKGIRAFNERGSIGEFIDVCGVLILTFILTIVSILMLDFNGTTIGLIIAIIGFLFALFYWWTVNRDNPNYQDNATSALGGDKF